MKVVVLMMEKEVQRFTLGKPLMVRVLIYDFLKPRNSRLLIRMWHFLFLDSQDVLFGASSLSSPWSPENGPWKISWKKS